tara:strand:- start:3773 stop:3892 length:120 start_codon:yes stop_codon:yes gene_type:complete
MNTKTAPPKEKQETTTTPKRRTGIPNRNPNPNEKIKPKA